MKTATAFLLVLISLTLAESLIGLIIGIMFPDFSETIRIRFISFSGALLGMFSGMVTAGVLLVPYGLYMLFNKPWISRDLDFIFVSLVTLILTIVISAATYRMCISRTKKLFGELLI